MSITGSAVGITIPRINTWLVKCPTTISFRRLWSVILVTCLNSYSLRRTSSLNISLIQVLHTCRNLFSTARLVFGNLGLNTLISRSSLLCLEYLKQQNQPLILLSNTLSIWTKYSCLPKSACSFLCGVTITTTNCHRKE